MKESSSAHKFTTIFVYFFCLLWVPISSAQSSLTLLTSENKQRIEWAVWRYAVDTPLLLETIQWLRALTQESKDSEAIAELSRLEYMRAQLEVNKQRRIELFQNCISITNQSLTINSNDVRGLFWKAAAIGKVAEDGGVLNALGLVRSMEELLLKVVMLDETYENAGAHRALGRIYHLLPGFPISFGNNQKALMHLRRAYELFPMDVITRAFYADLLYDEGQKKEARYHADFVLSASIHQEDELEYAEYVRIARNVISKTNDRTVRLGSFIRFQE